MTSSVQAQFVAIGIGKYETDAFPSLPVAGEIRRVRKILAPLGLEAFPEWHVPMAARGGDAVRERLRRWEQAPADLAVLYWVGHGWSTGDDTVLVHAKSPQAAGDDGVKPGDLASAISRWAGACDQDPVIILILDACRSGGFVDQLNAELSRWALPMVLIATATADSSTKLPGFRNVLDHLFDKVYKGCESVELDDLARQIEVYSASTLPVYPLARRVAKRTVPLHWPHSATGTILPPTDEDVLVGATAAKDRQLRRIEPASPPPERTSEASSSTYRLVRPSPTRSWSRDAITVTRLGGVSDGMEKPLRQVGRGTLVGTGVQVTHLDAPQIYRRVSAVAARRSVNDLAKDLLDQLDERVTDQDVEPESDWPTELIAAVSRQQEPVLVVVQGAESAHDELAVGALLRALATTSGCEVVARPEAEAAASATAEGIYAPQDLRHFATWLGRPRQRQAVNRGLLVALALAQGSGLPMRDRILPSFAEAVADKEIRVELSDSERFFASSSRYLTRSVAENQAVYRLSNKGYREAVLSRFVVDEPGLQFTITRRCVDLAIEQRLAAEARGVDLESAVNVYLRRRAEEHARLAGREAEDWLAEHRDALGPPLG